MKNKLSLPNSWQIRTLDYLFEITSSKRVFKEDWKIDGVPFYRAREIVKLAENGFVNNELFISEEMFKVYSEKYGLPKKDDIMVTGVGTLGICYVVKSDDRFYFKDGNIIWLKSNGKANSRYVEYAFKSDFLRKQIDDSVGTTVGTYTIIKAKSTKIPLPPLPEQQRIVSILDEAFAAIAKAKANAEQNLKNAKELFESVLNSLIIDDGKLKMEKLGDVCKIKGRIGYRGYTVQDLVQKGEGAITLSPSNIQDNQFITDKCTYISWFKYEESPEIMVFEGDILFVKTGSTYGKVALVENLPEKATINPQFVVLKDIKCSNRFLYFALTTKAFKEKVENIVGGTATPTLSQTNLAEQTIPLPPLKEQQTIVHQLDALRAETQKLEALYQQKIANLEELKKSILQKAFAGELKT
jgi:type I restriction enzyme S subunit